MTLETAETEVSGNGSTPLLEIISLRKHFPIRKGFLKREVGRIRAVDDVTFHINEGETLGLVGESGCGKTTTSRCILRAIDPTDGEIRFRTGSGNVVDIANLPRSQLRGLRREMQMIFQDPFSSLNPRMTLLDIVGEPLVANGIGSKGEREDRVAVMYVGKLVEMAPTDDLFAMPKHPYTAALLSSVPEPDPRLKSERAVLQGEVANPANPPSGCYFHPRCSYAVDECRTMTPSLREVTPGRFVSCHRAEELELAGVIPDEPPAD